MSAFFPTGARSGETGIEEVDGGMTVVFPPNSVITDGNEPAVVANRSGLMANGGTFTMQGGSIIMRKAQDAAGATAIGGGLIRLSGVTIETVGASGTIRGVNALSAVIDFSDGTIITRQSQSHGAASTRQGGAGSPGLVTIKNSTIETHANFSYGAAAYLDSRIEIENVSITTHGEEARGLDADRATIVMNGGSIVTNGPAPLSGAVYSDFGGDIQLTSVTVTTNALQGGRGIGVLRSSTFSMTGGSVSTRGSGSTGVEVYDSTAGMENVAIATTGERSPGVRSYGSSVATVRGGDITTSGADSHALLAGASGLGGSIVFNGGMIRVNGSVARAIRTDGTGDVGGSGVYDIVGDMDNVDTGGIDLDFRNGSYFEGGTAVGDGAIDFIMAGSRWVMDKSSTLTSLDLIGGNVDFSTRSAPYGTLTTMDLSGNGGLFSMRTDIVGDGSGVNNTGDRLIVTGDSAGSHLITVADTGSARTDGTETLTIVETADGIAEFALTNDAEIGAYLYGLRRTEADDTDWELYSTGKISNAGNNTVAVVNSAYLLGFVETQTLLQRMGELRQQGGADGDIWARYYGGRLNAFSGQGVTGGDMKYHGLQLGVDKRFATGPDHNAYAGLLGGFTRGKTDFSVGDGTTTSYYGGVYGTFKHANGFYADAVGKYSYVKHKCTTTSASGDRVRGDGDTNVLGASLEVGKRFRFGEQDQAEPRGWFVEPQAQVTYAHYGKSTIKTNHGLRTRMDAFNSVIGRAGTLVGYSTALSDLGPIDVYAKVNYLREFKGNASYAFNGVEAGEYRFKGNWLEVGAGVAMQIREKYNLYADVIYADGNKFNQLQVNIGVRLGF